MQTITPISSYVAMRINGRFDIEFYSEGINFGQRDNIAHTVIRKLKKGDTIHFTTHYMNYNNYIPHRRISSNLAINFIGE